MSLRDEINNENKQHGAEGGSKGYLNFETGKYRLRVLVKPKAIYTHFFGKGQSPVVCVGTDQGCPFHGEDAPVDDKGNEKKPSGKFTTYVVDRADGLIKMVDLPMSVIMRLADFQEDEDYAYDNNNYPMPYDIKITVDLDNNDPKQKYKTEASPSREPVTSAEIDVLNEKMARMTPEQHVEKKKAVQKEKNGPYKPSAPIERGQQKVENNLPDIEYPEEMINPDDIPF